jgi:hypothetical protein
MLIGFQARPTGSCELQEPRLNFASYCELAVDMCAAAVGHCKVLHCVCTCAILSDQANTDQGVGKCTANLQWLRQQLHSTSLRHGMPDKWSGYWCL